MFYVYQIKIKNTIRYIGMTNDINRREKEHNRLCFKNDTEKLLYNNIRKTDIKQIKLEIVQTFKTRTEAKRYECMLILINHFKLNNLWQKVPSISDR